MIPGFVSTRLSTLFSLTFAWFLVAAGPASAEVPASPEPHYVYDGVGWLSSSTFSQLDRRLETFERESSSQLLVAIFPRIPAREDLVGFSQKVFDAWKTGLEQEDNGVILFIYAEDRKLRIHTGYGMEGVLPDARCKQIIEEVITPRLKAGKRELAISRGTEAIIAASKGEYTGTGNTFRDSEDEGVTIETIIICIIALYVLFTVIRGRNSDDDVVITGRGSRHIDWGGSFGGGGFGGGFGGGGGMSGGGGASGGW